MDSALTSHFGDALTTLANSWVWEKVGDDVQEVVDACKASVESWYSDMLIGSVASWLATPPAGWLLLDGSTHAEDDYPELFGVLDDSLKSGSDFTLPDAENAFPFGVLTAGDTGASQGSNTLNLTVGQLPSHDHDYVPVIPAATVGGAGPPFPTVQSGSAIPTTSTGDGDDIDKRPKRFPLLYAVYAGRT